MQPRGLAYGEEPSRLLASPFRVSILLPGSDSRSTMPGDFKLLFSIIARQAVRLLCLVVRFFQPRIRGDK